MAADLAGRDRLPEWAVEDDLAARCRMTLQAYHRWCWEADGTYEVARLRVKWVIDNLAQADQLARDARTPRGRGWQGGPADPNDSAIFEDADEAGM